MTRYKADSDLATALEGDLLTVSWNGKGASPVRAVRGGWRAPTIHDLS